jgi:hypothetical protein
VSNAAVLPMPDGRIALRVVSDSERRTFRACMRRHHYAYRLLRRPIDKGEALKFGSLWHLGQEEWWHHDGTPEEKLARGLFRLRLEEQNDVDPYHLVMAEELLVAYTARWGHVEYMTLKVEAAFEMALVNPETGAASRTFKLGGKIDAIVRDAEGRLHGVEHKTTSADIEEGSLYWKKVRALDTQISGYKAGARALGIDVDDFIYDVVRKPAIRPLKATPVESRKYTAKGLLYANQREKDETPEEYRLRLREDINERVDRYFARAPIVRLEEEERDHAFDVWQVTRLMREAELAGFAPKNPDACSNFGGCPYLPVCTGEASIDDDTRYRTASTAHEELASE